MAINVANVRTQISDTPRWWPSLSDPAPDTIGIGDGARVIFGLRFPNFIESSLTISWGVVSSPGPGSPVYTAQDPSTYSLANVNQVSLQAAPGVGVIVGSSYQATAFSDADLTLYLARAQALQSDDRLILKQVQFDLIDVIIGDQDKMTLLKQGDYVRDPNQWVASYLKLKEALRKDVTGDPQPGTSSPAFGTGSTFYNRYGIGGGEVRN
jgi:hypothetical protein